MRFVLPLYRDLRRKMKEIINFIEENVNGKTLFTKELVYKLENGELQAAFGLFLLLEKMWSQRLS